MIEHGLGMRLNDWYIFHQAAQAFGVWVLVRWTKAPSLKYIGRRVWDPRTGRTYEYIPKPIDCKPKTAKADVGRYELAGLVVDPLVHNGRTGGGDKARLAWAKFLAGLGVRDATELNRKSLGGAATPLALADLGQTRHVAATRPGLDRNAVHRAVSRPPTGAGERCFMVDLDPESRHYGCLTLNGKYLHGDYDLKDVIDPRKLGPNAAVAERLHGQMHMRADEVTPIIEFVNSKIGVPMLQHGGEMQYVAEHTGDKIEAFGPHGQAHTFRGYRETAKWYKYAFDRRGIDSKARPSSKYVAPPSQIHVSTSKGGVVLVSADRR
jgi:hypothetical protein